MKLLTCTAAAALLGIGIFALSLSLGHDSSAPYAAVAGLLFFAGVVRDYSPRRPTWEPSHRIPAARFPSHATVIRSRRAVGRLAA